MTPEVAEFEDDSDVSFADRWDDVQKLTCIASPTVEWGVRHEDSGRIERCSERGAHVLASPGVTPVSRVVGPWQDTTPNPPQTPKENNR